MSHVAVVDLEIQSTELDSLIAACEHLGLKVDMNRKTWKWFGAYANDYHANDAAYHHGFSPEEYGKCADAVIYDPNQPNAYEIGIAKRRDGKDGYVLLYDNWANGHGMGNKVGDANCTLLQQHFAAQIAIKHARLKHPDMRFKVSQVGDKVCAVMVRKSQV